MTQEPILFDEFFDSNLEERMSPFLTPASRLWSKNLSLRISILSALFLATAFAISFSPPLLPASQLLLLLVYFLAGVPKLINSITDLFSMEVNIDLLMTLAAFLSILIGSAMEGGLLLVLFAISGSLETTVTAQARSAIRSLHKLSPTKAVVIAEGGRLVERHIADIAIGATILVKAGEIVPLDGEVVEGRSAVDLSHLTGETVPILKEIGSEVAAGARNGEGALTLRVVQKSSDSTLSRIIQLVTRAQEAKPKLQRWVDKLSRAYAIAIISLTLLFALLLPPLLAIPFLGPEGSIYRALAFMIAASPCALIIALPIAYLSAVSSCARQGILLKGGVTLDALYSCRAVAFDKTGTLTLGQLTCLGVEGPSGDRLRAIGVAAALERNAVHPIAQAILAYAESEGVEPLHLDQFRSIPGFGLEAQVEGSYVYIGHPDYLKGRLSRGQFIKLKERAQKLHLAGELVSILLLGDRLFLFRFRDRARPGLAATLARLREEGGLRLLMLTGDHKANAKAVADEVGIEEFYADLRPEDKLNRVGALSKEVGLAMVGDGINDGPALARATTGISMGRVGSQTAIDASDIVLLQDSLERLPWLWSKAGQTQAVVRQNLLLAGAVICGASVAALLGWIPLWLAVTLHEGGTVVVGFNGVRLLRS